MSEPHIIGHSLTRQVVIGVMITTASFVGAANGSKVDADAPLLLKSETAEKVLTDCPALNRVCLSITPPSDMDTKPAAAPAVTTATREEFFAECARRNRVCVIKLR